MKFFCSFPRFRKTWTIQLRSYTIRLTVCWREVRDGIISSHCLGSWDGPILGGGGAVLYSDIFHFLGVKLDDLVDRSDSLSQQSKLFYKQVIGPTVYHSSAHKPIQIFCLRFKIFRPKRQTAVAKPPGS